MKFLKLGLQSLLEILRAPLFWIVLGVAGAAATFIPWWNTTPWWLMWVSSLISILSLAKGVVNYINDKSFFTGKKRSPAYENLITDKIYASQMEIAFWRWAGRSQVQFEKLSPEHREFLHQEIRKTISRMTPKDFLIDERDQLNNITQKTKEVLAQMEEAQARLDSTVVDTAREMITATAIVEVISAAKERIDKDLEIRLKNAISRTETTIDTLTKDLETMISDRIVSSIKDSSVDRRLLPVIDSHFEEVYRHLLRYLSQHSRRANVYLFIGVAIGLTGILLFSFYFLQTVSHLDVWALLTRAGLLLAFELFAMFFLRLYKASLTEILFFQNEITTIKAKEAGLVLATQIAAYHDYKPLMDAVSSLILLDRNAPFDRAQTTKALEERKLYSKEEVALVKAAAEVIRVTRGK